MWFGNLVTMDWWEDLWLNESFANFMSYLNASSAEGFDYKYVWSNFLDERTWAIIEDSRKTTHSIAAKAKDTDEAEDLFDGISYGKGACWLKQMLYLFGHQVVREGLKNYFHTYAFKNATLDQFLTEIDKASKSLGCDRDLMKWSATWLQTSGVNIVEPFYEVNNGKVTSFKLKQTCHDAGNNILRVQKFAVALADADMKIFKKIDVILEAQEWTEVDEFVGELKPAAVFLDHGDNGYAKFRYDKDSLAAFGKSMGKIEDSLTRKQIYSVMYELVKDQLMSGQQFLEILKEHIPHEQSPDVILDNCRHNVGACISGYIPENRYEAERIEVFDLYINQLLPNQTEEEIRQIIIDISIGFA
jgi:aminopeptidase N